ncbi:neurocan core protein-like [Parambassis ranga]|uniref:Neurocan core protein-like n=1 Tax=Parambassis ranga TaxID=210632 RepID=A0A6P7H591_9TELE|nr:neurocan core protein-like [Parambassis ranga]
MDEAKGVSSNHTGVRSSHRRFYPAVILCLGLLSVFLLVGLITLGVHYHRVGADLNNLTERLQTSADKLSSMTEERDRLTANLTAKIKELDRLQSLLKKSVRSSHRRFYSAVILCLGLLSVFLLVGLITLGVHFSFVSDQRVGDLTAIKDNLTERLQTSADKLSSMTEERDRRTANLTAKIEELDRLQSLLKQISFVSDQRVGDLTAIKDNLTERLQTSADKLSSMTEERDQLTANLTAKIEELDRLQSLLKQRRGDEETETKAKGAGDAGDGEDVGPADTGTHRVVPTGSVEGSGSPAGTGTDGTCSAGSGVDVSPPADTGTGREGNPAGSAEDKEGASTGCPAGWRLFRCVCYFFSADSASWERSRQDCREKGADLVAIDSYEEQEFLTTTINQTSWIGLNDRDHEGTWKWSDGTPLDSTPAYWREDQPDNGNGDPLWGEEDCVYITAQQEAKKNWNDRKCVASHRWICEKMVLKEF